MHHVLINAIGINYDWLIISTFRDKTIPRIKMNQLLYLRKKSKIIVITELSISYKNQEH